MQHTEDFIWNRLMWKAGKYALPSAYSFYFKDLSPARQQELFPYIDVEVTGRPVLLFTKPTNEWTLICTKQVIGNNNSLTFAINLSGIDSVRASVFTNTDTAGERLHIAKRQPKEE